MFPIEGENNKRWKNISTIIFLTEEFDYASKGTAGLKKAVKTKDISVFLYATYLFVKSSVRK
jgi:hypothetical protein